LLQQTPKCTNKLRAHFPGSTAFGRKRTLVLPDFGVPERPLSGKADNRHGNFDIGSPNGRAAICAPVIQLTYIKSELTLRQPVPFGKRWLVSRTHGEMWLARQLNGYSTISVCSLFFLRGVQSHVYRSNLSRRARPWWRSLPHHHRWRFLVGTSKHHRRVIRFMGRYPS